VSLAAAHVLRAPTVRVLRDSLLGWFDRHARDLPWRVEPRDPYAVWVSEIMLQQTRVATVIPYFERFMRRFPTVESLALAPADDVLAAWSGLGYYRRARAMHAAAKQIVEGGHSSLPGDHAALLRLSGIGQYTAAAIASIAFGQPVAVVDGNVVRVLSRLTDDGEPMDTVSARRRIQSLADRLIDPDRPGPFNEAMMELGAVVCTPRSPSCGDCPWQERCLGLRAGRAEQLPVTLGRDASPHVALEAFVLLDQDRVLLCRRRAKGLFGGLWEPPMSEAGREGLRRLEELVGRKGQRVRGKLVHVLTHRVLEVRVTRWLVERKCVPDDVPFSEVYEQARWVGDDERRTLGMSSLAGKVLAHAGMKWKDETT
jgi:A/G-specific adenine glycosylase